jgi:GAF domain-containing protein
MSANTDHEVQARRSDENFRHFNDVLETSGVRAAFAYLVGLTDYRFISLYRFKDQKSIAVLYYDREHPTEPATTETDADTTYCWFVRDQKQIFSTVNAASDPQLQDHPKREIIAAYCGLPIFDERGDVLGTLCHYDPCPRDPAQLDMHLLMQVISALKQGDHIPPYPATDSAA